MSNALPDALRHFQSQRFRSAEKACRRALKHEPNNADAHHLMAVLTARRGDNLTAVQHLKQAIALAPNNTEARYNLGKGYRDLGHHAEAISTFETVLLAWPTRADVWIDIGLARAQEGQTQSAAKAFDRAIELGADGPQVYSELGRVYLNLFAFDAAESALQHALTLDSDCSAAKINLAILRDNQGQAEQSIALYDALLVSQPNYDEVLYRRALALLQTEALADGWAAYASRHAWRHTQTCHGQIDAPMWSGEDLTEKSLLVWTEQGIGDEILLGSILPDLARLAGKVTIACSPRVAPLFARSFPTYRVVERTDTSLPIKEIGAVDFQASLTEIGAVLRPDMTCFSNPQPFLRVDTQRSQALRSKYSAHNSAWPVIGIAWRSASKGTSHQKSVDLHDLTALFRLKNAHFVSLQYGDSAAERAALEDQTGTRLIFDQDIDPLKDLDAFAHQVAAMDLVISTSNTTVHAAGGLGKTCWALIPEGTGRPWYWFRDHKQSPWYPAVHLYRQHKAGDWSTPLAHLNSDFEQWMKQWPNPQ